MPVFDTKGAKQLIEEIEISQRKLVNVYSGIPNNSTADRFHQAVSLLRVVSEELDHSIQDYDRLYKKLGVDKNE